MPYDASTNANRHFERTIRDLETKLARQKASVVSTEEMIEAIKALRERETQPSGFTTKRDPTEVPPHLRNDNATKPTEQKTK